MPLWGVVHPFYCAEKNYYVGLVPRRDMSPGILALDRSGTFIPGDHVEYASWQAFDWKDSDPDLHLLFRWDWESPDPDDYEDGQPLPPERLCLFWMLQRKGLFMITSFPVARPEEPEIRAWLTSRAETILAIWEPILQTRNESEA